MSVLSIFYTALEISGIASLSIILFFFMGAFIGYLIIVWSIFLISSVGLALLDLVDISVIKFKSLINKSRSK